MVTHAPECVWDANARLGESPVWDERDRVLYWIDVERPAILRFDPGTGNREEFPMPEKIGSIALRERGGLIAAMRSGFCFVDLEGSAVRPIVDPEKDLPGNRFNDGKCDVRGRFWAGTMQDAEREACGARVIANFVLRLFWSSSRDLRGGHHR